MTRSLFRAFAILALGALSSPLGAQNVPEPEAEAPPAFARDFTRHAVAADQPIASQVGAEILEAGGNAADAAAATMLALGVVNPASSGMGGGGFLLYYKASDQSLTFLDFRERAPAASSASMYDDVPNPGEGPAARASQLGGLASGVPGEPAGIDMMVTRFGALPLETVVAPSVKLAEDGFPMTAYVTRMTGPFGAQMREDDVMREWFASEQGPIEPGTVVRRPTLGRTLRAFGERGAQAIYDGPIAREIVSRNRARGGIFTAQDLRDYEVVEREPLSADHFGLRFVTAPPPSAGGYTMLQSLAILDGLPERYRPRTPGSNANAGWLHAVAESWKGPFFDRQRYFGDPDHVSLPIAQMLSADRVAARISAFHPTLAMPSADYDLPIRLDERVTQPDNTGTSHLCVVDGEGNIASVTTTVNLPFGARYTAAGIVMNDEMDDFARAVGEANAFGLVGGAPNLPGPGRRPVSTMSPTIVFDADGPRLCAGAAGGSRIVTAIQQVAMNTLLLDMPLGDALSAPRIHHQGTPNQLRVEEFAPLPEEVQRELRARGHVIEPIRNVAVVQAIRLGRGDEPAITAGCDPRKGGLPAGR